MSTSHATVSLTVQDVEQSIAFYRLLGLTIPDETIYREGDLTLHVGIEVNSGLRLDLDAYEATARWAPDWQPATAGARTVFSMDVAEASAVDDLHATLTEAGNPDFVAPFDAGWGSRFAVVADPDGHLVGIMGPSA